MSDAALPAARVRWRATQMLVLATAFWGLSFPIMKAMSQMQAELLPGRSTWFIASLCVVYRFGLAALIMALFSFPTWRQFTKSEWAQGLGIGVFGGAGILFQMDGLSHTDASTSAFLTQCYCLILPLWAAVRDRRRPAPRVYLATTLILFGVAVLARMDWRHRMLGRGEIETLIASVIFTGQILWLERPQFSRNNVNHFSTVMFAVTALCAVPSALLTMERPSDWVRAYATVPVLGCLAILVIACTLGAYLLMNHWQRHVGATLAGLLYCIEPVFASVYALFFPAWLSAWAGIQYANESVTVNLLLGGGLITAANVLAQWPERWSWRGFRVAPVPAD